MKKVFTLSVLTATLLVSLTACDAMKTTENTTLETIAQRRSVRRYTEQKVSKDTVDLIIRAAMAAPSSKDRRPWHFIVLEDRASLDSLANELPYAKMLAWTQQAIIVCGDEQISESWYLDCAAASQNILLAIQSLGLAGVWTGVYPNADRVVAVQEGLKLPDNVIPLAVIPFGYGSGTEKVRDKYDPGRIHWNRW